MIYVIKDQDTGLYLRCGRVSRLHTWVQDINKASTFWRSQDAGNVISIQRTFPSRATIKYYITPAEVREL